MKYIENHQSLKVIIIDFSMIPYIDSSAMEVLENLVISMKKYSLTIHFVWLRDKFITQIENTWYIEEFGEKNIFPDVKSSIKYLRKKHSDLDLEVFRRKR